MIAHGKRRGAHDEYPQDASLTEGELLAILRSFGASCGGRGFSTDDAMAVVGWAEAARVEATMLALVLGGTVGVDLHPSGEILFVAKEGTHATR